MLIIADKGDNTKLNIILTKMIQFWNSICFNKFFNSCDEDIRVILRIFSRCKVISENWKYGFSERRFKEQILKRNS